MQVRCKFQLISIKEVSWNFDAREFCFQARYDERIEEDRRFMKASPMGEFTVMVDNPAVIEHYKLGHFYYFDSSPVPVKNEDIKNA
jgi:hypothetical protein